MSASLKIAKNFHWTICSFTEFSSNQKQKLKSSLSPQLTHWKIVFILCSHGYHWIIKRIYWRKVNCYDSFRLPFKRLNQLIFIFLYWNYDFIRTDKFVQLERREYTNRTTWTVSCIYKKKHWMSFAIFKQKIKYITNTTHNTNQLNQSSRCVRFW